MSDFFKNKNGVWTFTMAGIVIVVAVVLYNGRSEMSYRSCSGVVWTTQYNITYESDRMFDDSIQNVFTTVDNSMSMFNKTSLISKINKGENIEVDSMLAVLYKASLNVNRETGGAFDPTVSPLMKIWGFVDKNGIIPDSSVIDSVREFVGIEKTSFDGKNIIKNDIRTEFDFSAIAKGFACDEIGRMLRRNGVENYLIEVGGEIALNGVNPKGMKWRISIDAPVEDKNTVIHENTVIVNLDKGGIATSGNYRNYMEVDGRKIVHTMNPATGYPEVSDLLSATVIADNCMLADAYATACMVMGLEGSKQFLHGRDDLSVMLIYAVGRDSMALWSNDGFSRVMAEP